MFQATYTFVVLPFAYKYISLLLYSYYYHRGIIFVDMHMNVSSLCCICHCKA